MTPGARAAAAIQLLDRWLDGQEGLDRLRTRWGREARYAGSGDRRAVGDLCYGVLRRLRSAWWAADVDGTGTARDAVRGALLLDGTDPDTIFTGEGHAPSRLEAAEQSSRSLDDAPREVRLDLPDWMLTELERIPDEVLAAMRERAPVDLRVNLLKASSDKVRAALAEEGIATEPVPLAATALRVVEGSRKLRGSRALRDGLIEIQDTASQAAAALAGAQPGETVLDLCAGAGGKALAMAASMKGQGRLAVHDKYPRRMADLPARAARAGAALETIESANLERHAGEFDLVFVDAPCSGSGTWRRDPESKWRLDRTRLSELQQIQADILDQAARLTKPEGRLVYATCSLMVCENQTQIDRFLDRHENWHQDRVLHIDPTKGGDGFFAARMTRVAKFNQS